MAVFIDRAILRGLITASIALAAGLGGYPSPALAVEFGALTVRSHLNQPLDATVALKDLDASDRASLDVGIASPALFQRFGIRRSSAVDRIKIDTKVSPGGHRAVVHIATERPVREPFVDFLLQVDSGNGRMLREYTAMLDPAAATTSPPAKPTGTADRTPAAVAAQTRSRSSADSGDGRSRHRVQPGETLWSIAAANTPPGATRAQTMLAIYRANSSAFHGSMNALAQNTQLTIPVAARIRAVDPGTARQRLQRIAAKTSTSEHKASAGANTHSGGKLAANGEAPPPQLRQDKAPAPGAVAAAGTAAIASSAGAGNQSTAASHTFGRLSLPSDSPWPTRQASTAGSKSEPKPSRAGARHGSTSGSSPATAGASGKQAAGAPAATATQSAPAAQPSAGAAASEHAATAESTPVTNDVAQADESVWLSPRNLLLLVALLGLIALGVRRLHARADTSVTPAREKPPEEDADTVTTPDRSAAAAPGRATNPGPAADASDWPEAEPAAPTPEPDLRPDTHAGEVSTAQASESVVPEASRPDRPGEPAPSAGAPDGPGGGREESPTAEASEPASSTARDHSMPFEPVAAPQPAESRLAHRSPATNQEIEALAFEAQSLPDTGERQHDLGGDHEPGLAFEADDRPVSEAPDAGADPDRAARGEPYDLEMIDPDEFDLYDPPSETVGQAEDDPNDSVAMRLDLARMYIEMDDDKAAHELLADVRERGDEQQRAEAERLLEGRAS